MINFNYAQPVKILIFIMNNLNRFLEAQDNVYHQAMHEIQNGEKKSHWMWFIFPQVKGLGFTQYNIFFGIEDLKEAQLYYDHPVLGKRLIEITCALLEIENKSAVEIMGRPDERKLKSSMTLFSLLPNSSPCFELVLQKFYNGEVDEKTIQILAIN
ncbi:DUF1810 domain-containing protein [Flavobacterium sp. S87F.05.LMB.W.Kidney.N]|uniref:DUF1810 domain-containing protein n=1 Tax=Flavobacterium sp. S87F.05.LMB.W.Kidney.N TaxID=1278758 RepID=UPI0010DF600C|nr:DUF1810 domain-containing protein [Flavobacterium sp. S87F.05.LMB.W.Kidney.N]TDX11321.1 uncharacterized protein (DUF1810 family) [Flavobacterium sp. S87F.05.LMB.W.Kidney.N]